MASPINGDSISNEELLELHNALLSVLRMIGNRAIQYGLQYHAGVVLNEIIPMVEYLEHETALERLREIRGRLGMLIGDINRVEFILHCLGPHHNMRERFPYHNS